MIENVSQSFIKRLGIWSVMFDRFFIIGTLTVTTTIYFMDNIKNFVTNGTIEEINKVAII